MYRGQGVPQAVVIFHPVEDTGEQAKKLRPFAYADAEGNFDLKTYVTGDGAPPGKYRVSIIAHSIGPGPKRDKDAPAADADSAPLPSIAIPEAVSRKYASVDTSGIEVEIKYGENNLEPFELM